MKVISKKFLIISLLALLLIGALASYPARANTDITFDNLDPIKTSLLAFKEVNDYIDSKPAASSKPVLSLSPNLGARDYSLELNGIERVSTLWSDLVLPGKLNVVLFTENDPDWVDKKQKELSGEWMLDNELQSVRLKKYGCNIGGMYLPGNLYFCVKEKAAEKNTSEYYADAHKFAHEYTHFMEMNVKNWMGYLKGQGIGKRNTCWIEEGFATFYGFAVGSYPTEPTGQLHRKFLKGLTYNYDNRRGDPPGTLAKLITEGKVAETKRLFGMLENTPWPCDETQNAYALGSLAAEALVAVKGQQGMVNFYKASARTGDWKAAFLEAFGISVDSFYEKLTPYLASQFNEANFKYSTPEPSPTASPSKETTAPTIVPTPIPTPTPPTSFANKKATIKQTITCVKGKSTKKVTGINPKCPSGYKKK